MNKRVNFNFIAGSTVVSTMLLIKLNKIPTLLESVNEVILNHSNKDKRLKLRRSWDCARLTGKSSDRLVPC